MVSKEDSECVNALTKLNRGLRGKDHASHFLTKEEQIREVYHTEVATSPDVQARDLKRQRVFMFDRRSPGAWFEVRYVPPTRRKIRVGII